MTFQFQKILIEKAESVSISFAEVTKKLLSEEK